MRIYERVAAVTNVVAVEAPQLYTRITHADNCSGCLNVIEDPKDFKLLIFCNECGLITQEVDINHN